MYTCCTYAAKVQNVQSFTRVCEHCQDKWRRRAVCTFLTQKMQDGDKKQWKRQRWVIERDAVERCRGSQGCQVAMFSMQTPQRHKMKQLLNHFIFSMNSSCFCFMDVTHTYWNSPEATDTALCTRDVFLYCVWVQPEFAASVYLLKGRLCPCGSLCITCPVCVSQKTQKKNPEKKQRILYHKNSAAFKCDKDLLTFRVCSERLHLSYSTNASGATVCLMIYNYAL